MRHEAAEQKRRQSLNYPMLLRRSGFGRGLGCCGRLLCCRRRGCGSGFHDRDVINLDRTEGPVVGVTSRAGNLLYEFDGSIVALTENGVAAVQAGVGNFRDKELRTVGAGSSVGIREAARSVEG